MRNNALVAELLWRIWDDWLKSAGLRDTDQTRSQAVARTADRTASH